MTKSANLTGAGLPGVTAQAILGSASNALTATGTTQADAYYMSYDINVFTTVAASTGAVLPVSNQGDTIVVVNNGANTLSVYPPTGGSVANQSTNTAYSLPAGCTAEFLCNAVLAFSVIGSGLDGSGDLSVTTVTATTVTGTTVNASSALQVGGVALTVPVSILYTPVTPTQGAFFADRAYNISSIVARAAVASNSAATYTFWKAATGVSGLASGVQISTGVFDLQSGAKVNRFIAVTATGATLATGDTLGLVLAGASETAYGSVTFNLTPT
jgi:hypothetical protein